jgi:hypothetical protein
MGIDVADSKNFPTGLMDVLDRARENGQKFRFLAVVSDYHPSPLGYRRVIYYKKPAPAFAKYEKKEYVVPEDEVNALVETILNVPEHLDRFKTYSFDSSGVRDLFVCTHGSHDVCCGKYGYPLYKILEEDYAAKLSGKLRVWRSSHFGGHRYAPTIADLPEGRYWAHLEPDY